jgi:ribosomal protein S27E
MPTVSRPVVLLSRKGERSMRVKCISCGNELNLTGWVFKDHSGQAKCFIAGI